MHGTATVGWLLTALCAVTSGACLLRARGAGGMRRQAAWNEALMGLGMAVMALSGSVPVSVPPLAYAVLFGGLFGVLGARELTLLRPAGPGRWQWPAGARHHVHHLVGALAMVYMALAMHASHGGGGASSPGGHAHGDAAAAAGSPLMTGGLLAYFTVYVLRTGLRLLPARSAQLAAAGTSGTSGTAGGVRVSEVGGSGGGPAREDCAAGREVPGLAAACRLAMATGMLAMLLLML